MMADLDRITELLLSEDFGADVPDSLMGRMIPDTEPTLNPLLELLTDRQGQDDFLMNWGSDLVDLCFRFRYRALPQIAET